MFYEMICKSQNCIWHINEVYLCECRLDCKILKTDWSGLFTMVGDSRSYFQGFNRVTFLSSSLVWPTSLSAAVFLADLSPPMLYLSPSLSLVVVFFPDLFKVDLLLSIPSFPSATLSIGVYLSDLFPIISSSLMAV